MARNGDIGLYKANNIVSRAVGTPGVGTVGDSLNNASQDVLVATQRLLQAEAAKIKVADNIEAENHKIQWENSFYNDLEKQKQDKANLDNPYGFADTAFAQGQQSAAEYAQSISNPRARDMFLAKSQDTVASAQTSMRKWASDQTTTNAFVSLSDALTGIQFQAGKVKNIAGYNGLLTQGEALIANAAPVIGVDKAMVLRKQLRNEVSKNFIYSQIDTAPGTVKKYLDQGVFDKTLDAQDQLTLKNAADTIIKRNQSEQKVASALGMHINVNQMRVAEAEGKLTLGQIDQAIVAAERSGARKSDIDKLYSIKIRLLKGGNGIDHNGVLYPKKNDYEAINKVADNLGYITGFTQEYKIGKGGIKVDMKNTTLNKLQKSQDLLDENRYKMTKSSADKFQNIIDHGWMVYTDKNKYASNLGHNWAGIGKTNMDDFNTGLVAIQTNMDRTYKIKQDKQMAKAKAIQYYNRYYDQARKMPGFSNAKFTQHIINKTRLYMESNGG